MSNPWTPGPWTLKRGDGRYRDRLYVESKVYSTPTVISGKDQIAQFTSSLDGHWQEHGREVEANARLIAAAPEMAELLERVIDVFAKWTHGKGGIVYDAEQILARIRGEAA